MNIYIPKEFYENILEGDEKQVQDLISNLIAETILERAELIRESALFETGDVTLANIYDIVQAAVDNEISYPSTILDINPYDETLLQGYIIIRVAKQSELEGAVMVSHWKYEYDLTTNPSLYNGVTGIVRFEEISNLDEMVQNLEKDLDDMVDVPFELSFEG